MLLKSTNCLCRNCCVGVQQTCFDSYVDVIFSVCCKRWIWLSHDRFILLWFVLQKSDHNYGVTLCFRSNPKRRGPNLAPQTPCSIITLIHWTRGCQTKFNNFSVPPTGLVTSYVETAFYNKLLKER